MRIITEIEDLRRMVRDARQSEKSIGFIPTMGFLHEGHLALIEKARLENDMVVTSVFVNPTQFGPNEDFDAYPRNPEKDQSLMAGAGVDAAFFPAVETLYPEGFETYVEVGASLTQGLCGASRPGHFRGVATIVTKLLNIIQPDRAYFGQKDAQQVAVIRKVVKDLNIPVEIVPCPIVREADGLAMSSRNTYLNQQERQDALVLSQSLMAAQKAVTDGIRMASEIEKLMLTMFEAVSSANVEYIAIVDALTFNPIEVLKGQVLVAVAVRIGKVRLIDNCIMEVPYAG